MQFFYFVIITIIFGCTTEFTEVLGQLLPCTAIIMSNSLMQRIYYIMLLHLEVICLFCTYFLLQGDCCTQNDNCEK